MTNVDGDVPIDYEVKLCIFDYGGTADRNDIVVVLGSAGVDGALRRLVRKGELYVSGRRRRRGLVRNEYRLTEDELEAFDGEEQEWMLTPEQTLMGRARRMSAELRQAVL